MIFGAEIPIAIVDSTVILMARSRRSWTRRGEEQATQRVSGLIDCALRLSALQLVLALAVTHSCDAFGEPWSVTLSIRDGQ